MIRTARLTLRGWQPGDVPGFHAMCADPAVMEHLPGTLSVGEAADAVDRLGEQVARDGHGFWAVERSEDGQLLGFCGVRAGGHAGTPVPSELEMGWRLRRDAWGQGYAREAAAASLAWAWANTAHDRVAAWTVPANARSWRLMERLAMERRPDLDFDHPMFAPGHRLCRHIVYVAGRPDAG